MSRRQRFGLSGSMADRTTIACVVAYMLVKTQDATQAKYTYDSGRVLHLCGRDDDAPFHSQVACVASRTETD